MVGYSIFIVRISQHTYYAHYPYSVMAYIPIVIQGHLSWDLTGVSFR